ncbi:MAG TPA: hypothetical protein VFU35_13170 [Jatrophihabitans sp.]|nr:hypothetical protein [Jatrophihabitans sp.]
MASARTVEGFLPSVNGFRFTNHFPPAPTVRIDLGPVGTVGLGNASQGVCGGMAFAVRDYFEADLPIPQLDTPPAEGTKLFNYVTARLIDSFNGVDGVATYIRWMWLPSADVHLIIGSQSGTFSRTVSSTWPAVRADIDANHPSPLGLVTVHTSDIRQVGKCHQVLAYGYRVDDDKKVTLQIYDPNTDHDSADDVWISFSAANAHKVSTIDHNVNIAESTLHGFFRSAYAAKKPPQL